MSVDFDVSGCGYHTALFNINIGDITDCIINVRPLFTGLSVPAVVGLLFYLVFLLGESTPCLNLICDQIDVSV